MQEWPFFAGWALVGRPSGSQFQKGVDRPKQRLLRTDSLKVQPDHGHPPVPSVDEAEYPPRGAKKNVHRVQLQ